LPASSDGVDSLVLVYVFCCYLIGGFIKGLTGLGFSAVAIGIMATFLPMPMAIPLVVIPSMVTCVQVMRDAGHFKETVQRFSTLYFVTLPGLLLGLWLLANSEAYLAKAVLGGVLSLYGIWGLLNPTFRLSNSMARHLRLPTGLVTGTIHGLTGVAVMPVTPYLLSLGLSPNVFIQAVNISFLLSSVVIVIGLQRYGFLGWDLVGISLAGLVPVMLAVRLGVAVRRRLSTEQFRFAILLVLIGLGLNLIIFGR
jgi:uncharacterized membrane protein YfcA